MVGDDVTILQGQPALATVYEDSTVFAFDFSYFYFGRASSMSKGLTSASHYQPDRRKSSALSYQ